MTLVERLLWLADELAANSADSDTVRRRAVSTAYYAVFHAIAHVCACEILDRDIKTLESSEFEHVYRQLDHGSLKTVFASDPMKRNLPLRKIGGDVVRLQSERNRSDYLPKRALYSRSECVELVKSARETVGRIDALSDGDRRVLVVHLIFKKRPT